MNFCIKDAKMYLSNEEYLSLSNDEAGLYDISVMVVRDFGSYSPVMLSISEKQELDKARRTISKLVNKVRR